MRIVVTGLVATYPMGGMSWAYLSYVDGLRRLGHDVIYLEDTGGWFYDPSRQTFTAEIRANLRYLERALRFIGAGDVAWAVRGPDGCLYGMESGRLAKACHGADLFLNLSGSCWLRDEYRRARRTAYVDTDPGYTQAKLSAVGEGGASERDCFSAALVRAHDRFFTFAEHIGAADCRVPRCGLRWMPTRQPLVLDHWPFCFDPGAPRFTTVMSWNSGGDALEIGGIRCGGKQSELNRLIDLPKGCAVELEIALAGGGPRTDLRRRGWRVRDARAVSRTMAAYRRYLQLSRGEWSVAKKTYVALRSGWFSERSAAYLALGKPVVVQDTAWTAHYPAGQGLFGFSVIEEAVSALAAIDEDYRGHCEAARALAEDRFAHDRVLGQLLVEATS